MHHILDSEEFFLSALNLDSESLEFLRTDIGSLHNTSFLDGRTGISLDQTIYPVSLSEAMAWYASRGPGGAPGKVIFHVSFCGSTLLSRTLDTPGRVLVYKEPQVLTDLEQLIRKNETTGAGTYDWTQLLGLTLSQFSNVAAGSLDRVVKPSNLVNALAPAICGLNRANRAVFMVMDPRSFLVAVLRGGSPRVSYIYRLLENIGPSSPQYGRLVNQLDLARDGEMTCMARKILLAHGLQHSIFERAMRLLPTENYQLVSYAQLLRDPQHHVYKIASALDLGLSRTEVGRNVSTSFKNHSKEQSQIYDPADAAGIDAQVVNHYGAVIDAALDWYEQQSITV